MRKIQSYKFAGGHHHVEPLHPDYVILKTIEDPRLRRAFGVTSTYENGVLDDQVKQTDIDAANKEMESLRNGGKDCPDKQRVKKEFFWDYMFFPFQRPGLIMDRKKLDANPYYNPRDGGYRFDIDVMSPFFNFYVFLFKSLFITYIS